MSVVRSFCASVLLVLAGAALADGQSEGLPEGPAARVVSADGAVTEILYALGAESLLVAVDTTSRYPPQVDQLPKVGYLRALPFEGVLALNPELLLTTEEAAPEKTLSRLREAGVEVVQLPAVRSTQEAMERILSIGQKVNRDARAALLVQSIQARIDALAQARTNTAIKPRVLFLLAAGGHGLMLAGANTTADSLISAVGAENSVKQLWGYKPANREALLMAQPDAIVIAETAPGHFDIDQWPQLRELKAWQAGHYHIGDSMLLLGFGPRLPIAMEQVSGVLPRSGQVAGNGF